MNSSIICAHLCNLWINSELRRSYIDNEPVRPFLGEGGGGFFQDLLGGFFVEPDGFEVLDEYVLGRRREDRHQIVTERAAVGGVQEHTHRIVIALEDARRGWVDREILERYSPVAGPGLGDLDHELG